MLLLSHVGLYAELPVVLPRRPALLWGQLALTIFLVACAVLAIRQRLGL